LQGKRDRKIRKNLDEKSQINRIPGETGTFLFNKRAELSLRRSRTRGMNGVGLKLVEGKMRTVGMI